MTDRKICVFVELYGTLQHVGQLWAHSSRGKEGLEFIQKCNPLCRI